MASYGAGLLFASMGGGSFLAMSALSLAGLVFAGFSYLSARANAVGT